MGREVRRVPADWQHPTDPYTGRHKPMFPGEQYQPAVDDWDEGLAKWKRGEFPEYADADDRAMAYEQWSGQRPHRDDYMPNWPAEQRTHLMMYEDTSEGTPISPAFATPEELARWLTDNKASWFGGSPASYEAWLETARGGWMPDLVFTAASGMQTGAELFDKGEKT
jgi:hypothetical protein